MNYTKQPAALSVFSLTEIWERYGFALLETLLILALINVFGLSDQISYAMLGSLTALAYINALIGGYVADRYIGHRMAVLLGALFLSAGYYLLSGAHSLALVCWALGVITMGTGLLKPNVSSMVGSLYDENDPRRHSGFTIFYIGINVGNMLGSMVPSYIQEYFGWQVTYLSAAFMLLIAFGTFFVGIRLFKLQDVRVLAKTKMDWLKAAVMLGIAVEISHYIIKHSHTALVAFFAIALISVGIVLYEAFQEKGKSRARILAYLILVGISTLYWALYFQVFFSMNLFVDRVVDRNIFGFTFTASTFVGIESVGVIIFGVVLSWVWVKLKNSRFNPSTPMKFALGLSMHALAFAVLFLSSLALDKNGMVMPIWVILVYLIIAVGELLLSPIGLSMVTELVPKRLVGMMMGIFFISLGLGGKLAGVFAAISSVPQTLTNVSQIEHIYQHAFLTYFLICFFVTLASLALVPMLKKLIKA